MTLTGYNGQYELMGPMERNHPGLKVRKIDSSQGGEAEVVIFSMAVSRTIGFLRQIKRQNVRTSRAMNSSFTISHFRLLSEEGAEA